MDDDVNPLLFAVQRIREEAEQRRILARALAESAPLERLNQPGRDRSHDKATMRMLPIMAPGVGGTAPGTQPLGALLSKERRSSKRRSPR